MMQIDRWRFEPGDRDPPANQHIRGARMDPLPRGWYCQVRSPFDLEAPWRIWLEQNCPSAEVNHRWN